MIEVINSTKILEDELQTVLKKALMMCGETAVMFPVYAGGVIPIPVLTAGPGRLVLREGWG